MASITLCGRLPSIYRYTIYFISFIFSYIRVLFTNNSILFIIDYSFILFHTVLIFLVFERKVNCKIIMDILFATE